MGSPHLQTWTKMALTLFMVGPFEQAALVPLASIG